MDVRKIIGTIVGAALGLGALFGYTATVTTPVRSAWTPVVERPWCPTEDSCYPDYVGETNSWVIREAR